MSINIQVKTMTSHWMQKFWARDFRTTLYSRAWLYVYVIFGQPCIVVLGYMYMLYIYMKSH